jgi:hypothetical protein
MLQCLGRSYTATNPQGCDASPKQGQELSTEHRRFTAAVYLLQFILVVALACAFSPGCAFPGLRVLGMLLGVHSHKLALEGHSKSSAHFWSVVVVS